MRLLERSITSKHPDPARCEDLVLVTEDRIAVIDGATDKSGRLMPLDGADVTSGRFAAVTLAQALTDLPAGTAPHDAVDALSNALNEQVVALLGPVPVEDRPSASIVVFDARLGAVWRVGDCRFRIDGACYDEEKTIDVVTSTFRAAFLAAVAGEPCDGPSGDPGREVILPLLRLQGRFANQLGEFGYGVLNGEMVPAEFVETVPVPSDASEVVLASDGYPTLPATLADAERELAEMLAQDPSCVGPLRSTKGLAPGNRSFDDRAWVRLALR